MAFGKRDIAGTGLFDGEYLVPASKRGHLISPSGWHGATPVCGQYYQPVLPGER